VTTKPKAIAIKNFSMLLLAVILLGSVLPTSVSASNGDSPATIDVWTNKGGKGSGEPGGVFKVGEETILYLQSTKTCQSDWHLAGPTLDKSSEGDIEAGTIYRLELGRAEESDIGEWHFTGRAFTSRWLTSDSVRFTVIGTESTTTQGPPASPPATPVQKPQPTPSAPSSASASGTEKAMERMGIIKVTALDALVTLKMAEGSLPTELNNDANGDGKITGDDARLLLKCAVEGGVKAASGIVDIVTGDPVQLTRQTIDTQGGTITANKPGDPLHGLTIEVPAGAYSEKRDFDISYSPIEEHNGNAYFNPITPLINIDNGGGYSEELMTLKIPVDIPEDHFAMAFYYDKDTGELDALPLLGEDSSSITVFTRHFSNLVVSDYYNLVVPPPETIIPISKPTDFLHGCDDWSFVNYGSFAAPDGHCAGQCLTAMYHYHLKDPETSNYEILFDLYDNDGNEYHMTPNFQWDDELAYKLCSKVQLAFGKFCALDGIFKKRRALVRRQLYDADDSDTGLAIAYAMLVTNQPQFVAIYRTDKTTKDGKTTEDVKGHAIIVHEYRMDIGPDGQPRKVTFSVSDPNYPYRPSLPAFQELVYDCPKRKFEPYKASQNRNESARSYPDVVYWGQAIIDYSIIEALWREMEEKPESFGQDVFPEYYLEIWSDDIGAFIPLTKTYRTLEKKVKIRLNIDPSVVSDVRLTTVDSTGRKLGATSETLSAGDYIIATGKLTQEDENLIGFLVEGDPKKGGKKEYSYIGFDWILFLEETELDLARFNHCIFSWNCQGHFKNLDEEKPELQTVVRNEPSQTLVPGSFSGTTFTGERIGEDKDPYRLYSYSITAVLSNDGQSIKTATVTYSSSYGPDNYLNYKFVAHDIPIYPERTQSNYIEYRVEGSEIAKHITIDREEIKYGQEIILEKVEYLPETVCSFSFSVQPEN
jgi:hypothetical protein